MREFISCGMKHTRALRNLLTWSTSLFRLRGNGEVVKREEFEQRKHAAQVARNARLNKKPSRLASQGKELSRFPLLQVRCGPVARRCFYEPRIWGHDITYVYRSSNAERRQCGTGSCQQLFSFEISIERAKKFLGTLTLVTDWHEE